MVYPDIMFFLAAYLCGYYPESSVGYGYSDTKLFGSRIPIYLCVTKNIKQMRGDSIEWIILMYEILLQTILYVINYFCNKCHQYICLQI